MKLGSAAEGLVGSDLEFPAFDPLVRRVCLYILGWQWGC